MSKFHNMKINHPVIGYSRKAGLISGISAVAAIGFLPSATQADEIDFASLAVAVKSAHVALDSAVEPGGALTAAGVEFRAAKADAAEFTVAKLSETPRPILSVGLVNHHQAVVRGEPATFIGYSNYPGAIDRGELRIVPADAAPGTTPHFIAPVDEYGAATWIPGSYAAAEMEYVYRVYDRDGAYDETAPLPLEVLHAGAMPKSELVSRPEFGTVDSAAHRSIGAGRFQPVIAKGRIDDANAILSIEGQIVPLGPDGSFSAKLLQPESCAGVTASIRRSCGKVETLGVPRETWQPAAAVQSLSDLPVPGGIQVRTVAADTTSEADHAIEVRSDGHSAEPVMAVGLIGSERIVALGKPAQFQSYTNYPSYVAKGEVRIFTAGSTPDSQPLDVVATDANGFAEWNAGEETPHDLFYTFRVYDGNGRFDETRPEELTILPQPAKIEGAPVRRPTFGLVDEARIRNIPFNRTATITVSGTADPARETVRVSGQLVPVDPDGKFITQQLVDHDSDKLRIAIESGGQTVLATTRDIQVPRSDWFFVGQGDLTFRSMNGSAAAVAVSGDPLADGNSVTSRAAFYTKGKFGDGWKLTASLDTGETLLKDMFSNLDRKDPRQLLRRLGSNEYYTTYGDDSTLVEDAPTQGQFYLKLQKADSSLLVGNYVVNMNQAELAPLDRGLFGIALDHKSVGTTSFGERKQQFTLFASDPGTLPGRDEFRGTGGSLYFLKRQDLTVGSERLRVEVRDRDTGIVLESHDLRPQEDYDIDYFQGRITLLRPLASVASSGGTVRTLDSSGNVPVLVARYEYTPPVGSLDGYTLGGRGSTWIGDKVRLGVSAQRETTDAADQTLLGADAMFRLAAGTFLKGEIAQTDGPAFGQANSVDGGLSFTDIAASGVAGRNAWAWKLEGSVDFAELQGKTGDLGKISAYYENFDAGFAASSRLTMSDTTRWGAKLALPIGASTRIAANYEVLDSASAGEHRTASIDVDQKLGTNLALKVGIRHDDQVPGLLYNSVQSGARTDAAVQLGYEPKGRNWSVYGFGQATIQNDNGRNRNNRAGIGGKADISDRLSLSAEVSYGDGGLGADVQLNRRYGQGSEAYIGYSLLADRSNTGFEPVSLFTRSNSGTLTVGARHRFSSALSIYGENRIGHGGDAPSAMRSFGAKFDPSEKLSFSASIENGHIDDAITGLFRRTAATFGFGYTTKAVQLGSSVEARFERGGGRDQKVWLFRNTASVQLNLDWRALGRLNFAIADQEGPSVRAADYVEGSLGFAYRPVSNDRLNVLARYSYFQDLGPVGQITAGGEANSPKQRSQIGVIDANYDLTKDLTIGAKYGYRQGKVSMDRTSDTFVSSNTHLGVLRLDWRPVKQWDLVAEGHYLSNDRAGDHRWGGLAAIYRHLGNNVKVGVGYSVSDFSDDLTNQNYNSKGFFLNLLGKF